MKILHVCLGCFYIDNYTYQENLLPKYHKKLGYDVKIVASTLSFDKNGNACNIEAKKYINENGIEVTRLNYKKIFSNKLGKFFRIYSGFDIYLNNCKPDIIFVHGCQFNDIRIIRDYAKKNNVIIYVDNHADFSNSARNIISKIFLHKLMWKKCAHIIEPYTTMFYGVLPARVDFLRNIYKIPNEKTKLLVMGADDELVHENSNKEEMLGLRKKLKIKKDDFVIVTGGKIDMAKLQILTLMKTVSKLDNIKLIIFGSVINELKETFNKLLSNNIIYVGWLNSKETYKYIALANIVVFPGRHSVLWEQTVAQGKPMVVKYWQGTTHIDFGGNVKYLYNDSEEEMHNVLKQIIKTNEYECMNKVAKSDNKNNFLYSEIAKKSIDHEKNKELIS